MSTALLVIDLQNDYFPGGLFPLANTDSTLSRIEDAIRRAQQQNIPVILVQHIADPTAGPAPFFHRGSLGADIHPSILAAAPHAPIITKHYADSFHQTLLERTLADQEVTHLLISGMMTQNCVTHTAISKSADKYHVSVLTDAATTVTEPLHLIALHALSTRVQLRTVDQVL